LNKDIEHDKVDIIADVEENWYLQNNSTIKK